MSTYKLVKPLKPVREGASEAMQALLAYDPPCGEITIEDPGLKIMIAIEKKGLSLDKDSWQFCSELASKLCVPALSLEVMNNRLSWRDLNGILSAIAEVVTNPDDESAGSGSSAPSPTSGQAGPPKPSTDSI